MATMVFAEAPTAPKPSPEEDVENTTGDEVDHKEEWELDSDSDEEIEAVQKEFYGSISATGDKSDQQTNFLKPSEL